MVVVVRGKVGEGMSEGYKERKVRRTVAMAAPTSQRIQRTERTPSSWAKDLPTPVSMRRSRVWKLVSS